MVAVTSDSSGENAAVQALDLSTLHDAEKDRLEKPGIDDGLDHDEVAGNHLAATSSRLQRSDSFLTVDEDEPFGDPTSPQPTQRSNTSVRWGETTVYTRKPSVSRASSRRGSIASEERDGPLKRRNSWVLEREGIRMSDQRAVLRRMPKTHGGTSKLKIIHDLIVTAELERSAGRHDEAWAAIKQAMAAAPKSVDVQLLAADHLYRDKHDRSEAKAQLKFTLDTRYKEITLPQRFELHTRLGNIYQLEGDRDNAEKEFRLALAAVEDVHKARATNKGAGAGANQKWPRSVSGRQMLAMTMVNLAVLVRATYLPSPKCAPMLSSADTPRVRSARKRHEVNVDDLTPAEVQQYANEVTALFEGALSYAPKFFAANFNYANFCKSFLKDLNLAERHYRQAVECKPSHVQSLISLGNLVARRAQNEAACALFQRALEVDPKHPGALSGLGVLLEESDPSRARDLFLEAIRANPRHADALCNLGNHVVRFENDLETAENLFSRALRDFPSHTATLKSFAEILHSQKRFLEAEELFLRVLKESPNDIASMVALAGIYVSVKWKPLEASKYIARTLSADPRNIGAIMHSVALKFKTEKDPEGAAKLLATAIHYDSKKSAAYLSQMWMKTGALGALVRRVVAEETANEGHSKEDHGRGHLRRALSGELWASAQSFGGSFSGRSTVSTPVSRKLERSQTAGERRNFGRSLSARQWTPTPPEMTPRQRPRSAVFREAKAASFRHAHLRCQSHSNAKPPPVHDRLAQTR